MEINHLSYLKKNTPQDYFEEDQLLTVHCISSTWTETIFEIKADDLNGTISWNELKKLSSFFKELLTTCILNDPVGDIVRGNWNPVLVKRNVARGMLHMKTFTGNIRLTYKNELIYEEKYKNWEGYNSAKWKYGADIMDLAIKLIPADKRVIKHEAL